MRCLPFTALALATCTALGVKAAPAIIAPSSATQAAMSAAKISADAIVTCSPDRNLAISTAIAADGSLSYAVFADGKPMIAASPYGLATGPVKIAKSTVKSADDVWKPVWGKRASVPDRYNETRIDLDCGSSGAFSAYAVIIRAYDDGIAFRYEIPSVAPDSKGSPMLDRATFNFAGDYTAWSYNGENPNIGPEKLTAASGTRMPVMTLKVDDTCYLALHEADLRSGQPMVLKKAGPTSFQVASSLGLPSSGYSSAWRVLMFGRRPGSLVDSHLIELLNPQPIGDFSWVKPGVAVWDWRINGAKVEGFDYKMDYPSWLRMVDFAAENHFRHLVLDANWYGPEFAHESDPTKGDKAADVKKLIAYGKTKDVGIWVYLNDVGGRRYPIEQTLKQYGDWGAAGVKYGFMNGSPAEKNTRTRQITELCAKYHLLCDFHDGPVHPYGQLRTFPNAVTREFCHAQLDAHRVFTPKTFVTTVFVNMLAGPIDMNNGMFDLRQGRTTRVDESQPVPSTLVSEAARTQIVFSGATVIPDIPEFYRKYPDLLAFLAAEKQPWRESKVLSGVIGEHIVMARQAADGVWLIGAATNEEGRELDIPLGFLGKGSYQATTIQDGDGAHYLSNRETFKTDRRTVQASDSLHVKLAPGGGACVILRSR